MDLSPFKRDIDELIDEFAEGQSTTLADMKRVWLSRKFSYIYEASPSTNLAFFMQSLYSHSIGYMVSGSSLSHRVGGLYCLYCLYETQPFKPPFKIYLSFGELRKLKTLVVDAKEKVINVVPALVKRMLEKNMFLYGFLDINESSVTETVNQLTEIQNAHVQLAHKKLFGNTQIEHFLHMDLGMEMDLDRLRQLSTEYGKAKKQAIEEASKVVDVHNIKHIAVDGEPIGDMVARVAENWNVQKEAFYQQTGFSHQPVEEEQQQLQLQLRPEDDDDLFDRQLEQLLSEDTVSDMIEDPE